MRALKLVLVGMQMVLPLSGMAKYEVHEWGTFTSLVGSNGITQNGMYHEDEKLPPFVHGFGAIQQPSGGNRGSPEFPTLPPKCRGKGCFADEFFDSNIITQKMETPVIYFYSDRQRAVDVNVRFPEGIVTETFPAPVKTYPRMGNVFEAANGDTTFHVDVLPTTIGNLPSVDPGNIYGHARAVDSNLVKINDEQEKFIFYRGIGRFQPRISIQSNGGNLTLTASRSQDEPQAIFLVNVDAGGVGRMLPLPELKAGAPILVGEDKIRALKGVGSQSGVLTGSSSQLALIEGLAKAGLFRDEAEAMVKTWENGYLKVPGLRLLYILPRNEADAILPLSITPSPENLERVFVGRVEILLDTEERKILDDVRTLGPYFRVSSLGRFAEPILRRVKEVFLKQPSEQNPGLASLLDRLVDQAARSGEIAE